MTVSGGDKVIASVPGRHAFLFDAAVGKGGGDSFLHNLSAVLSLCNGASCVTVVVKGVKRMNFLEY